MTTNTAPRSIDQYLRQLREALAGEDAALVQDALYDAEEYLRAELAAARAELEAERGEVAGLREREREAREEAELTLLQLHQVQEELEHYFLLARGQTQQIDRYDDLQRRSQRLLAQLVPQA